MKLNNLQSFEGIAVSKRQYPERLDACIRLNTNSRGPFFLSRPIRFEDYVIDKLLDYEAFRRKIFGFGLVTIASSAGRRTLLKATALSREAETEDQYEKNDTAKSFQHGTQEEPVSNYTVRLLRDCWTVVN
ncbi:MAG TPA: hypothetical protein VLY24_10700 [Bryobacteraceae bacterium]|nr:hypothetical protein [Bryobacteraceae bacterium]